MSRASSLYRLQAIDLGIDRARVRLREIEAALGDSEALPRTRSQLAEAEARLRAAQAAAKSAEHTAASHQAKLEQAEVTLYGGTIRNPKELQDLQNEVEALRRYKPTLEDRLLEAMVDLEEAELQREALSQEVSRLEELLATKRTSLVEERQRVLADVERLEAEREAALATVANADRQLYEQLRATRGGVALALLQDDSCSACGLTQSHSERQSIRMGADLVCCKQCGRILYAG
ncbi:MAG: hypothetical protein AB1449_13415 [Chloroflexota bacterium]